MTKQAAIHSKFFTRNLQVPDGQLTIYDQKNVVQDLAILSIFTRHPEKDFTARELEDNLKAMGYNYLLTSIRRAITTLKKANRIEKVGQRMERAKVLNNCWRLKK